ncbi:hypothetical protein [Poseidonibacter antarcticus]|uniref:hypothetical protein n=1 Tax=Poseidonibacter antarcticus TaxID=2478538 RepID=UPI000EF4AC9C|nr:hypothetical protein [Poseidonibacter antarcticus]
MIENKNEDRPYLKKLLKGDISLSITFWLWFIFLTLLINIFIDNTFLKISFKKTIGDEIFSISIYLLTLLYSILIFIAVQKSASKYIGNKLWPFLAKVIISINLFFSLFSTYDLFKVYFFEDYAIKNEINNLKDNLPLKVDSFSYLIDINIEDKNIYYIYQLESIINSNYNLNKFKSQVQDSLCENENTLRLLKRNYILDYTYIDKDENKLTEIITNKSNCGKSIYDLDILKEILKNE